MRVSQLLHEIIIRGRMRNNDQRTHEDARSFCESIEAYPGVVTNQVG